MKKFTKLHESVSTPQNPKNLKDTITHILESKKTNEEKAELFEKLMEIQMTKNTVSILENVKIRSYQHLDLGWIDMMIFEEKKKLD